MKIILPLVACLAAFSSSSAFAITRAMFYSNDTKAVITIQSPALGGKDKDAERLYALMNVTPETTPDAVSKTVVSSDGTLTVLCFHRVRTSYTCNVTILSGPQSIISERNGQAEFTAHDAAAQALSAAFATQSNGQTSYATLDQMLRIESRPGEFRLSFQQKN